MMAADAISHYYSAHDNGHLVVRRTYPSNGEDLTSESIVDTQATVRQLLRAIGRIYFRPGSYRVTVEIPRPAEMQSTEGHENFPLQSSAADTHTPLNIGEPLKITISPDDPMVVESHIDVVWRSVKSKVAILGIEHEETLSELMTLYYLYRKCKRWDDAEGVIVSVIATQQNILGPDNPATLRSMERLAKILMEKKPWKEAEDLVLEILNIRLAISRTQQEHNKHSLIILMDLINEYRANGLYEAMYINSLSDKLHGILKVVYETWEEGKVVLVAMLLLAQGYQKNEKYEAAEKLLKELVQKLEGIYGKGAASVLKVKQILATVYLKHSSKKGYMIQKARQLLIEIRDSLSKLGSSNPSRIYDEFFRSIDIYALQSETERLLSLVAKKLATISNIAVVIDAEEALENLPEDSPDRTEVLATLSGIFVGQFEMFNDPDDLDIGIMWAEQALLVLPEEHPKRAQRLEDLSLAIYHRYRLTSSPSDLETSIRLAEESILLTENGDQLAAQLEVLAKGLGERYERNRDLDDLDKAIVFAEQLTYSIEPCSGKYAHWIHRLSKLYKRKWEFLNDVSDLDEAIKTLERLEPTKDTISGANLVLFHGDLATLYMERLSVSKKDSGLDTAVMRVEEYLKPAKNTDPDELEIRTGWNYGSLIAVKANLYLRKYNFRHDVSDLMMAKKTIEAAEEDLVPLQDTDRLSFASMKTLIRRICDRIERGEEEDIRIWHGFFVIL
ncbi:hypothetical protein TWF281_007076 [Arthrobotrys megalospora]